MNVFGIFPSFWLAGSLNTCFSTVFLSISGAFLTSSCYRSCQFGGCAPKTPGGARARFQVEFTGAAPPKVPLRGSTTGGARQNGCGFPSISFSLAISFFSKPLSPSFSHTHCQWASVALAHNIDEIHCSSREFGRRSSCYQ